MTEIHRVAMTIDTSKILQIRAQILERNAALSSAKKPAEEGAFGNLLTQAVDGVTKAQAESAELSIAVQRGESMDVAAMMLARQKSSLSFQATLQVRNKLLSAYKDIMNMPV